MAAAAVVSVSMGVMKPVLAKLTTLMGEEYKKITGLRKEVTFLQRELGEMDALLEKMDAADELDPQAKKWRRDIIEMSYNIEDRIDDFMHCIGEANDKMGILRKASQFLRTFKDRRRLANEFQEIKTLVTEASDRRKRYMLDQYISVTTPVTVDPRMSALYKDSASLVGIEAQKNELINWAMEEAKQLKVMAIVGFGGLGKTTLANEVYHHVGDKFQCKAFISVSQRPQIIGLLNSLLSQLGLRTYSHDCQLEDPINGLRRHLHDKRYFIVVDDLWDLQVWDTIQCAFPESNPCSKVIITTRNENLAGSCCSNPGFIYKMKHLSEQHSRKLFFDRIFGSEDACPTELEKVSCEILKKCGGLPLAIITMASMLACQPRRFEEQWEYIKNSLDTKSATKSKYEDMLYILDLSYKNLPRHLKACFLYLGSYPEDHEIERRELVMRWVAEGFVSNSSGQDIWDVAESYFNELVNRSMIQPMCNDYNAEVSWCKVHDMLLDLIMKRCKEDNFLHLVNDPEQVVEVQVEAIRRLTVVGSRDMEDGMNVATITSQNHLSQIRTLTILLNKSNWKPLMLEFKFLRVLLLINCHGIKMDQTFMRQLSQLRYLTVQGRVVPPFQIQGLRLLETLDLQGMDMVNSRLIEIADVPRLCHLFLPLFGNTPSVPKYMTSGDVFWDGGGTWLPDGTISEMRSLRTLDEFYLPKDPSESNIAGLGELTALSYLCLEFPRGCTPMAKAACMAALSTSLAKLGNLRQLMMFCDGDVAWCADALSSLSPPFHKLERLDMNGCTISRVPRWLGHLQNLHELRLGVKQMFQEDAAIIGIGAPSLLRLQLWITGILSERIAISGSMGFPVVKNFEFNCDRISYLSFEAGAMPELQELELVFDANEWDKAAPGGLQHLPSLRRIRALRCLRASNEEELIKGVFQEAADALPTRPTFFLESGWRVRPIEEEDNWKNSV